MIVSLLLAGLAATAPPPLSVLHADFDGDGRKDELRFEVLAGRLAVTLRTAKSIESKVSFEMAEVTCSPVYYPIGVCDQPQPQLGVMALDKPMVREFVKMFDLASTDMLQSNGKAHVVEMPIGETDPIWFYWNASTHRLDWLRL